MSCCTYYLSGYAVGICTCGYVPFVKEVVAEKMVPDLRLQLIYWNLD